MSLITKLSNGISVVCESMPNLRSVSIGICIKVGSKYEEEGKEGISHFLEHMLFKGTDKRSAFEISETMDRVGGDLNAFTTKEITTFYATTLDEHVSTAVDVLTDMFLNSKFDAKEMEKERNVIIDEIKMYEDLPEDIVHEANLSNVLKGSKLATPVLGSIESVKSITRDDLVNYYKKHYVTNNMFISIAGKTDCGKVIGLLETALGRFSSKMGDKIAHAKVDLHSNNLYVPKQSSLAHLCVNTKGVANTSDDIYKLQMLSSVIGSGPSSRLFRLVREDMGLAYSVYSYLSAYGEGGVFTTYVGTVWEAHSDVANIIKNEYKKLRDHGVTDDEMFKVRNQMVTGMVFDVESSKTQMFRNLNLFFSSGEVPSLEEVIEMIDNISKDDLLKMAQDHFNPKHYSYTVLGGEGK